MGRLAVERFVGEGSSTVFQKASHKHKHLSWRESYQRELRVYDALTLLLALAAAQALRFGWLQGLLQVDELPVPYWLVGLVLAVVWWAWLELRGTREVRLIGNGVEEAKQLVTASLTLFAAIAIASYALNVPTARGYILIALPAGTITLLAGRMWARHQLMRRRAQGLNMSRTMVVGRFPGAVELVGELQSRPDAGFDPVAVYMPASHHELPRSLRDVRLPANALAPQERPSVQGIVQACREHDVETLVMAAAVPLSTTEIRHLGWALADERIRLVMNTGLTDVAGPRIHTQQLAGLPLIHVATPRFTRAKKIVKRCIDIVGSLTALIVLSPLLLVLGILVKAHDGGPAFFAQERVGIDGTRFRMLKFRSMYTDAEERKAALLAANESDGGVLFKMKDDPRVTAPGKWMRRYSLDELPQFINVLNGTMSLVGPRPPLASEVDKYEQHVYRRLRVRPGITGLWQVSGRSNLDWNQTVRLDLYYVENWSPVQDMVIMLRTVRAVFASDGAY
ncbi:putative glycosyltransferase [Kocuria rhizophila DC2201]|uniref:Putative glycosyltransferase n=1 Tax=Kocuria rhizophila (strain ATCC 9341 / DSM 348 / NBRC 103217 / DC2201) TaxID=378753 RepID=B2GLJ4_KOCRD|nr:putative glycosyltransferase [Kocuria rhizophila DC2201]